MNQKVLDNCRDFYITCLVRGRIPVSQWKGRWHYSSEPEAFEDYLAKFDAESRSYITKGLGSPRDSTAQRAKKIADSLHREKIEELIETLKKKDPGALDRVLQRQLRRLQSDGRARA